MEVQMAGSRYRWQQLADQIRNGITAGTPAVGELLPSIRTLQDVHRVSDNTVNRALAVLADEGFVKPEHGIGVRVISAAPEPPEPGIRTTEQRLADLEERVSRLEQPETD